jgi:diguanylate cyclase (GGDEF)-like protein
MLRKLLATFAVLALLLCAFTALAIVSARRAEERTALREAEKVARVIATGLAQADREGETAAEHFRHELRGLSATGERDVLVADRAGRILADPTLATTGELSAAGRRAVAESLADGRARTFVAPTLYHPDGAKQIVVPVDDDADSAEADSDDDRTAALVYGYTDLDRQIKDITARSEQGLIAGALAALLAIAAIGLLFSRDLVRRVGVLRRAVADVAGGAAGVRVPANGRDELGDLAVSFNTMAEQLERSQAEVRLQHDAESGYREAQIDFSETMQVTRDEREAHAVVKVHLERMVPGSSVVVLNRNNSADRLEATTGDIPEDLRDGLEQARPDSCMAVRLGRAHHRAEDEPKLLECEICGASKGSSVCQPSLVGGEVIGAVLVRAADRTLEQGDRERVAESVSMASPVLANLRIAEARAATDALTGLPNARSAQHSLRRTAAHAAQHLTPLAAVMLDLDHFKQVNDRYGHGSGDEVLAALGELLRGTLRGTDFAARVGGEEFLLLLPDSDEDGAVALAEKLRAAVERISAPRVEQPLSASFGVAVYPRDAQDGQELLRAADRALYTAKRAGRNRVVVAERDSAPVESA